ncbi:MAG: hypothetical protein QOH49_1507 [Acidobacteriota bacterium]|jgi:hypothetical protein|nr:hypothetical protein [Acidobacteriota bacterium]
MSDGDKPKTPMSNGDKPKTAGLGFLDFLFTVAIGAALTPEKLGVSKQLTGVLAERWVQQGDLPRGGETFDLAVFALGFLTFAFSWFGYHRSVETRPLKYDSVWSMFRFVLDILLIILYALAMVQYKNLRAVLFILVIIFFLYIVWDVLKVLDSNRRFTKREWLTVGLFVGFLLLWLVAGTAGGWLVVGLAILLTFVYRVGKMVIA